MNCEQRKRLVDLAMCGEGEVIGLCVYFEHVAGNPAVRVSFYVQDGDLDGYVEVVPWIGY